MHGTIFTNKQMKSVLVTAMFCLGLVVVRPWDDTYLGNYWYFVLMIVSLVFTDIVAASQNKKYIRIVQNLTRGHNLQLRIVAMSNITRVVGVHFKGYTPRITDTEVKQLATCIGLELPFLNKNLVIAASYLALYNHVGSDQMDSKSDGIFNTHYKLIRGLHLLWKGHPNFKHMLD